MGWIGTGFLYELEGDGFSYRLIVDGFLIWVEWGRLSQEVE
jgi:hypothetical protein